VPAPCAAAIPSTGPAPGLTPLLQPPLPVVERRTGIVVRVQPAQSLSAFELPALTVEEGAAAGTAPFLCEEGLERRNRVDLATT